MESKPDLGVVQHVAQNPPVPNDLIAAKKEGAQAIESYIKHMMFISGLKDHLRVKTMEAGKTSIAESRDFAIETERIYQRGQEHLKLSAIEETAEPTSLDLQDEEVEAINAIRARQGRPLFQKRSPNPPKGSNFGKKCRYCKKMNHMQKECRARIRDRAPMVDADGKPFTQKVQAVGPDEGTQDAIKLPQASAISKVESEQVYHLNW